MELSEFKPLAGKHTVYLSPLPFSVSISGVPISGVAISGIAISGVAISGMRYALRRMTPEVLHIWHINHDSYATIL